MAYTIISPSTTTSKKKTPSPPALGKVLAAIDQQITAKPIRRFGMVWCRFSRKELASVIGVHTKTIGRCLASDEIQYDVCRIEGIKTTLLRKNDGKNSEEYINRIIAKAMKKEFKKSMGRDIKPKDFGGLMELAKRLPKHFQLRIFRYILTHWGDFAASYKLSAKTQHDIHNCGLPFAGAWYMKYPNVRLMKEGWQVGLQVYEIHLQEQSANKIAKTFFLSKNTLQIQCT